MAMLVFFERPDLDQRLSVCEIPDDEIPITEFAQKALNLPDRDVDVVGENLGFHPGRPIFEAAGSICDDPKADKKQPGVPATSGQFIVEKKARFDLPNTCHGSILLVYILQLVPCQRLIVPANSGPYILVAERS
jgi:hypothetical protein